MTSGWRVSFRTLRWRTGRWASFGVMAAYNEFVPGFERLFEREGQDFGRFYAAVARLAALPKAERHATLSTP